MQHDDRILARLDYLVEVTDSAIANGPGQWTVLPHRTVVPDQETSDQVAGGQVIVTGNSDERTAEPPCHVLDEARLPASRGSLEHDRQASGVTALENRDFVPQRNVVRLGVPGYRECRFRGDATGHQVLCGTVSPGRLSPGASSSTVSKRGG